MRRLRIITAVILALLWVPSAGHCLLAATFPQMFGACCECESETGDGHEEPMDEGSCTQCVTLETGVNLSVLSPIPVPVPPFWEEDALTRWVRRAAELTAMETAGLPEREPVWSPPPLRTVTLTKARPVRGPSIAA